MQIKACPHGSRRPGDSPALPYTPEDVAAAVVAVRAWTVLPDFASVNWHEHGAAALLDRGVQVEAGLWHLEGVAARQVLHGEGTSCWPALGLALRRRLDTRIGLEDVLHPDGSPAPDNAALVRAATAVLAAVRAADGAEGADG